MVPRVHRPIVLLTDFGHGFYVGELKSRLCRLCPGSPLIDLTHDIPGGDVRAGAFVLTTCLQSLPARAVVLAVVDPGVGSPRAALALRAGGRDFVGPDNGILSPALEDPDFQGRRLKEPWAPSARRFQTFQGRDLFAPAAAELARGRAFQGLGPLFRDPLKLAGLKVAVARRGPSHGLIEWVDGFGNLLTSLHAPNRPGGRVRFRGRWIRLVANYAEAGKGEVVALWESHGYLEIAKKGGRADRTLSGRAGQKVLFAPREGAE